jgi:hypothetical protein
LLSQYYLKVFLEIDEGSNWLGFEISHVDARELVIISLYVGQSPSAFAAWMDSAEILLARETYAQTNELNNVIPATVVKDLV